MLKNPTAQQNRLLRTTLVPNLLALVGRNRVHRDSFQLFEIGRVYSAADDGASRESSRMPVMRVPLITKMSQRFTASSPQRMDMLLCHLRNTPEETAR